MTNVNISVGIIVKTALIILGILFLYVIREAIIILFISVLIVLLMEPAINWLQKKKISRGVGVLVIYFLFFSVLGLAVSFFVPPLVAQSKDFYQKSPEYFQAFDGFIQAMKSYFPSQSVDFDLGSQVVSNSAESQFSMIYDRIFMTTISVFSGFFSFIMVLVLAFYMSLKENGIKDFILFLTPKKHEEYVAFLFDRINNKIGRWMQGQLLIMLGIFIVDFIWLSILGIPYPLILALLAGLLEVVPFFGPIVSAIPGVFLGFLISPWKGLLALVLYTVTQQIEGNIVVPQVMKKATGMNPIVIILALLVGFKLGGVLGAILIMPVVIGISVVIEDLIKKEDKAYAK